MVGVAARSSGGGVLPDRAPVELAGGDRLPVLPDLDLNLTGDRLFGWLAGAASPERA